MISAIESFTLMCQKGQQFSKIFPALFFFLPFLFKLSFKSLIDYCSDHGICIIIFHTALLLFILHGCFLFAYIISLFYIFCNDIYHKILSIWCRFCVFITFSLLLHNWNCHHLYILSPLVFCARLCYGKSSNLENLCSTASESVLSDTRYAILKA